MAPNIQISEELFKELQGNAEPLIDSVEDVIWKLLRHSNDDEIPNKVPSSPITPAPGSSKSRLSGVMNQRFARAILLVLRDGGPMWPEQVLARIAERFGDKLSDQDWTADPAGQIRWHHRVHATRFSLKELGLLNDPGKGVRAPWEITPQGLECLGSSV